MKTPITYYGGKQLLASTIIGMMPAHRIYCEPFFGGGAVFFAKGPSFLECINDKNDLIVTFYRECVNDFDALNKRIKSTLHAESEHKRARCIYNNPRGYSDIDIAWAVWVTTNMSIMATTKGGWKCDNGTGGSHVGVSTDAHRVNFTNKIYNRLRYVQISCRDAIDVIRQRDSAETFFYLDPPYINCDQQHYAGYTIDDFQQLLEVLTTIKGKFILSNFWSDILEEYIARMLWNYKCIESKCMIPALKSKARSKTEVLVYNYLIQPTLF